MATKIDKLKGTFYLNKEEPIHRWYQYIEGYSSPFVKHELDLIGDVKSLYDPFGGCGTSPLTAAKMGIVSHFSETNPFMVFMCNAKTNLALEASKNINSIKSSLSNLVIALDNDIDVESTSIDYGGFEKFYDTEVLNKILRIERLATKTLDDIYARDLAYAGLACILVRVSNMVRRGDLRFATEKEKSEADKDVYSLFKRKMMDMLDDLSSNDNVIKAPVIQISEDARDVKYCNVVDCIITSPPYLNGTNYIRNTKLELKLLGFVEREEELSRLHSRGIIAGINNVSKRNTEQFMTTEAVERIIEKLTPISYDDRIPKMILGYFHGMEQVISRLRDILINNGKFIMDIGDSQFSGVHVPTHEVLISIASKYGFRVYENEVLRSRISKNGMKLTQRIIRFKLHK